MHIMLKDPSDFSRIILMSHHVLLEVLFCHRINIPKRFDTIILHVIVKFHLKCIGLLLLIGFVCFRAILDPHQIGIDCKLSVDDLADMVQQIFKDIRSKS